MNTKSSLDIKQVGSIIDFSKMSKLTDEQELILADAKEKPGSKRISARAGSGKTFLLKMLAGLWPHKKILYVTFSKELVEEAKTAGLPLNVDIKTAHSLGYQATKKFYSPSKQMSMKEYYRKEALFDYLKEPMFDIDIDDDDERELRYQLRCTMLDLLNYCKVNLVDPSNEDAVNEVVEYYGIGVGNERPMFYNHLRKAYEWNKQPSGNIFFADMVWAPVYLKLQLPKYDIILADEIQDSSIMIMSLYEQCLAKGGQIIGVGDDWQAIYGFAGSRNESMDLFAERFGCADYSLSVNFRCGQRHIELAQTLVPDIKAHDNAIEGAIINTDFDLDLCRSGDLIICRTNMPLVGPCLKLVKSGIKANIKGRDIAGPINTILDKVSKYNVMDAIDHVLKYQDKEIQIAERRKMKGATLDAIADRYGIALDFLKDADSVKDAKDKLYKIFSDETPGVIFCSAHKSKGLQAKRVTIINADRMRISRPDMLPWQHEQEAHLQYVAYTRPQEELVLVPSSSKKIVEEE